MRDTERRYGRFGRKRAGGGRRKFGMLVFPPSKKQAP